MWITMLELGETSVSFQQDAQPCICGTRDTGDWTEVRSGLAKFVTQQLSTPDLDCVVLPVYPVGRTDIDTILL